MFSYFIFIFSLENSFASYVNINNKIQNSNKNSHDKELQNFQSDIFYDDIVIFFTHNFSYLKTSFSSQIKRNDIKVKCQMRKIHTQKYIENAINLFTPINLSDYKAKIKLIENIFTNKQYFSKLKELQNGEFFTNFLNIFIGELSNYHLTKLNTDYLFGYKLENNSNIVEYDSMSSKMKNLIYNLLLINKKFKNKNLRQFINDVFENKIVDYVILCNENYKDIIFKNNSGDYFKYRYTDVLTLYDNETGYIKYFIEEIYAKDNKNIVIKSLLKTYISHYNIKPDKAFSFLFNDIFKKGLSPKLKELIKSLSDRFEFFYKSKFKFYIAKFNFVNSLFKDSYVKNIIVEKKFYSQHYFINDNSTTENYIDFFLNQLDYLNQIQYDIEGKLYILKFHFRKKVDKFNSKKLLPLLKKYKEKNKFLIESFNECEIKYNEIKKSLSVFVENISEIEIILLEEIKKL